MCVGGWFPFIFVKAFSIRVQSPLSIVSPLLLTFDVGVTTLQGILTAFLVTCNCRVLKLYTVPRHKQHKKYVLKNGCYKSLRDCEKGQYGVLSITNPNYDASGGDDIQQPHGELSGNEDVVDIYRSNAEDHQHPLKVWRSSSSQQHEQVQAELGLHLNDNPVAEYANPERRTHTDTFLAVNGEGGSECDKSFSATGHGFGTVQVGQQEVKEDRILTPRMIKCLNTSYGISNGSVDATAAGAGVEVVGAFCGGNNKKSIQTLSSATTNGKLSGALRISELPRRPLPSAV